MLRPFFIIYCIGMLWFAGFMIWAVLQPENQNAGGVRFFIILAIAAGPCAILAIYQRIRTGRWIS